MHTNTRSLSNFVQKKLWSFNMTNTLAWGRRQDNVKQMFTLKKDVKVQSALCLNSCNCVKQDVKVHAIETRGQLIWLFLVTCNQSDSVVGGTLSATKEWRLQTVKGCCIRVKVAHFKINWLHPPRTLCFHPWPLGGFVGLSGGLHKNYRTDFHKTWRKDGSQPRIETINFWYISG